MKKLKFEGVAAKEWPHRYAVIPGKSTAFTVRNSKIELEWRTEDYNATGSAVESPATGEIVASVLDAKSRMGGSGGGRFQINEFGQVLVPASSGDGRRMFVGEIRGDLVFNNPVEGNTFSLNDDLGLKPGSVWDKPYVGVPYNLSGRSQIYFWGEDEEGGHAERPVAQDAELIKAIRGIRRYGAARFLANPHGIVLTKRPPEGEWRGSDERWIPVYVGRLDYSRWFTRPTID
jgi:hypothetical protein